MIAPNPDFINFGGLLIPEQDSQAHFAFTGTTGSGKTLLMRLLQQSILRHVGQGLGYRAIVYDAKQDAMPLLSAYCDHSRLFTLNPFDDRGVACDIAADVCHRQHQPLHLQAGVRPHSFQTRRDN